MSEEKPLLSPRAIATIITAVLSCGGGASLMVSHGSISAKLDAEFEKTGEKLDKIKDEIAHLQGDVRAAEKTSSEAIAGLAGITARVNLLENEKSATHVRISDLERRIQNLEGKK